MLLKVRGKVFGSLKPNEISIHIGYNYGMNDGGRLRIFQTHEVPINCRFPNTYVWVTMENGNVLHIEKMTDQEIQQN